MRSMFYTTAPNLFIITFKICSCFTNFLGFLRNPHLLFLVFFKSMQYFFHLLLQMICVTFLFIKIYLLQNYICFSLWITQYRSGFVSWKWGEKAKENQRKYSADTGAKVISPLDWFLFRIVSLRDRFKVSIWGSTVWSPLTKMHSLTRAQLI